jgi:hypothetical protein
MIASETNIRASVFPTFTGRDVPISELAQATGKSAEFLKRGLREGIFDFGYVMKSESGNQYRYFCPDKLVWEKLGYFNPAPDKQENEPEQSETG